jgi:hypothetical protein
MEKYETHEFFKPTKKIRMIIINKEDSGHDELIFNLNQKDTNEKMISCTNLYKLKEIRKEKCQIGAKKNCWRSAKSEHTEAQYWISIFYIFKISKLIIIIYCQIFLHHIESLFRKLSFLYYARLKRKNG